MWITRTIFLFLGLLSALNGAAQGNYPLLHTLALENGAFTTDGLQQVYLVTPQQEVVKYDALGNELGRYSNRRLGKLGQIDANNPFNVLLYYPDFQTIITLDRSLGVIATFNLFEFGAVLPTAVAFSEEAELWVYDRASAELKKYVRESGKLREEKNLVVPLEKNARPTQLLARAGMIYLNVPTVGIFLFDRYGHFLRTLPLLQLPSFQVIEHQLFYRQNHEWFSFDVQTLATVPIRLPPPVLPDSDIRFGKGRVWLRDSVSVRVFGSE